MITIRTYIRVSSQQQADSGLGAEAQRASIAKYIKANYPDTQVAEYMDLGVGGSVSVSKRSGLSALIDDLNAGDVVVAYDHSRIARDIMVSIDVESTIERLKATLEFITGANGDNPEQLLMRRILNTFAEYERKKINERTSNALQAKKAQGYKLGAAPFGYTHSADRKSYIINSDEMEIVEIVKVLRNQKNPWRIVADELNKLGYTNRRGNNWSTNLCSITFKGRY
tara:strand:+ start:128 stop:805 length:678 start_codon:yes stop_codon:yes gene_type:complete